MWLQVPRTLAKAAADTLVQRAQERQSAHTVTTSAQSTFQGVDAMGVPTTGARDKVIKSITTGFAFFALVVLVTETILAWTAIQIGESFDRTFVLISSVAILVLLSLVVALLLYSRPWVLTGDLPPAQIIRQVTPPPYTETTIPIQYFLRGIREYYFHVLTEANLTPPNHFRMNLMLVVDNAANKPTGKVLRIKHVDYQSLFTTDEFLQEYPPGIGNCGEAWRLGIQRSWAADLLDAEKVSMENVESVTAVGRRTVLSSPIWCSGECIGILNLDSDEDSKTTYIRLQMVLNLLDEAAREIVPMLFPASGGDAIKVEAGEGVR